MISALHLVDLHHW